MAEIRKRRVNGTFGATWAKQIDINYFFLDSFNPSMIFKVFFNLFDNRNIIDVCFAAKKVVTRFYFVTNPSVQDNFVCYVKLNYYKISHIEFVKSFSQRKNCSYSIMMISSITMIDWPLSKRLCRNVSGLRLLYYRLNTCKNAGKV